MVLFDITVVTIRLPRCVGNLSTILGTMTHPTRLHILTGAEGKMQTLNQHFQTITDDVVIQVVVDDDIRLYHGWQDDIADAFHLWPEAGVLGLDLSSTAEGVRYMLKAANCELKPLGGLWVRDCTEAQNVGGIFAAMRRTLAKQIGPYPHIAGRRYCIDEDAWRCEQAILRGFRTGYVKSSRGCAVLAEFHDDSPDEKQRKEEDWQTTRRLSGVV